MEFSGRYVIERPLGLSRTSALYAVKDNRTSRVRALKLLLPSLLADATARRRFEEEARITASIRSDHIIDVLDAGVDADTELPYLVTELLEGKDLATVLKERGALPTGEVLNIVMQVARGLEQTFERAIAHRDLKPENLFLSRRDGHVDCVVILDFGIAKSLGASNKTDSILGTPLYLAPEQVNFKREEVTPVADLYALGMVTYTLLTGEPYFTEEADAADSTMQFFLDVVAGPTEPATRRASRRLGITLPPLFDTWFERATALRPNDRFESPAALCSELERALSPAEQASTPQPIGHVTVLDAVALSLDPAPLARDPAPANEAPAPPLRRRGRAITVAGVGMVAAAGIAALALATQAPEPPHRSPLTAERSAPAPLPHPGRAPSPAETTPAGTATPPTAEGIQATSPPSAPLKVPPTPKPSASQLRPSATVNAQPTRTVYVPPLTER